VTRLSFYLRREWLSLMLMTFLCGLMLNCVYGPLGPRDLLILRQHRADLAAVRDRLAADNARLGQRITRLRSDDAYIQRLIRQELGYAHADEYVYRFADHKTQTAR
jgi:cell division protein FtsB